MSTLIQKLKTNNMVLNCSSCGKPNLEYVGSKDWAKVVGQYLMSKDFRGLGEVPDPKAGDYINCYFCKAPLISKRKT
jgi:hypothetical protein